MSARKKIIFVVYIFCLIIPFIIYRKMYYEPYPAIILPGGFQRAAVDSAYIALSKYSIYVILENGSEVRIDEDKLLHSLPRHYRTFFWKSLFAKHEGYRKFDVKIGPYHIYQIRFPPQLSFEQKNQGRRWLQDKMMLQMSEKNINARIERILLRSYKEFYPIGQGLPAKPMEMVQEMTFDMRN